MYFKVSEKNRRILFYILVLISFCSIFVFNYLTPYLSDDLYYNPGEAKSFLYLVAEQYESYFIWNGRAVLQFLMRIFFALPAIAFDVANSAMFVAFALLIYANVEGKKKYDVVLFALINLFIWLWGVSFAQTILWQSGAHSYLWGIVIMLGFVTVFRHMLGTDYESYSKGKKVIVCSGLLLYGIIAGWCNENTSGGILLIILGFLFIDMYDRKKADGSKIMMLPWQIASIAGMIIGLIMMVISPGNWSRNTGRNDEEAHTGLMAYLARFLKLNAQVMHVYSVVFVLIVILTIYLLLRRFELKKLRGVFLLVASALATSYVLMFIATPSERAHFGAWAFLMIACMQLITYLPKDDVYLQVIKYASVVILSCYMFFDYCEGGADLLRIDRELAERQSYVEEQRMYDNRDLTLPMIRKEFDTRYSFFFANDISDESEDAYGNQIYKHYYHLDSIRVVPREEWTEY